LMDEEDIVSYKIDITLISIPVSQALEITTENMESIDSKLEKLEKSLEELNEEMGKLKGKLYAKFGKAINLERDLED